MVFCTKTLRRPRQSGRNKAKSPWPISITCNQHRNLLQSICLPAHLQHLSVSVTWWQKIKLSWRDPERMSSNIRYSTNM